MTAQKCTLSGARLHKNWY